MTFSLGSIPGDPHFYKLHSPWGVISRETVFFLSPLDTPFLNRDPSLRAIGYLSLNLAVVGCCQLLFSKGNKV